jgi:uncharacterized repeat protein (TIGR03803 family)
METSRLPAVILHVAQRIFAGFLVTITCVLQAQNPMPATARQAAALPQFAPRLARKTSYRTSPQAQPLLPDDVLYDNGPVNGTVDAWTINFGYAVTDSIIASATASGIRFYAWLIPGDTLQSVEIALGTSPFGTDMFDGSVPVVQSNCSANEYGYQVCQIDGNWSGTSVNGTNWLTLQNAVVNTGDPVYWDENSGVGCSSPGCPSQADFSAVGTIPSESFQVEGGGPPTCDAELAGLTTSPQVQSYQILHNFSGGSDGGGPATGLIVDRAGSLYGTNLFGYGQIFKLSPHGSGWLFSTLYDFQGGTDGSEPYSAVTQDYDGTLYGATWSGAVFHLQPAPNMCPSLMCTWRDSTLYQFSGGDDGRAPYAGVTFDASGDFFGTTYAGGGIGCSQYGGCGVVYEMSRSGRGWKENTIYRFGGPGDGSEPSRDLVLVFDRSGNLYGTTSAGGAYGQGTVFELSPTENGWTEQILYSFQGGADGSGPSGVIFDQSGNLYGMTGTTVFEMSPSGGGWSFHVLANIPSASGAGLTMDSVGNLYGASVTAYGCGAVWEIVKGQNSWVYTPLHIFGGSGDGYQPWTTVTIGPEGNLYGTAYFGGTHNLGVVWQIIP